MELINKFSFQGVLVWAGYILALAVSFAAAFFGTAAALKRKTVWSAAASSIAAALGLMIVFYVFALDAHIPSEPEFFMFAAFVFWCGAVLAVVFGFSGLQEIASSEFARGRRYAWTGLLLGIFLPFLLLHSAAVSIRTGFPAEAYKNLEERFANLKAEDLQSGEGQTKDGYKNFPEFNFRFKIPDAPWSEFNYKAFDPANKLGYMRLDKQLNFSISIAPEVNVDFSKFDELVDTTLQIVKSGMPDSKVSNKRDWTTAAGLKGKRLELEGTANGIYVRYYWWFFLRQDGTYFNLLMWQPANLSDGNSPALFEEMLNRFESLNLNNPSTQSTGSGNSGGRSGSKSGGGKGMSSYIPQKFTEDFESPLGYRVKTKNSAWMSWPNAGQSIEFADFGMIQEPVYFFAMPSFFLNQQPTLEAYAQAMLDMVGIDFSSLPASELKKISKDGYDGYEISHKNPSNGYFYQAKVFRGKDRGFFISAAQNLEQSGKDEKKMRDAVDRFQLVKNPAPVKLDELNMKTKELSGLALNQIGLNLYQRNNKEEALNYFKAAFEFFPDQDAIFENYIKLLIETGRHEEADKALKNSPGRSKSNATLGLEQAKVLYEVGKKEEALKQYQELLKSNPGSGEVVEAYAGALWEMQRRDEALKVVEERLKSSNSVNLKMLYSQFLAETDKADEAVLQAKQAHEEFPGYEPARQNLYNLLNNLGRYEEMREASAKEIQSGQDDFYSHLYSGMSQYELSAYRDAQESFQKALTYNSQDALAKRYADDLKKMLGYVDLSEVEQRLEPIVIPDDFLNASVKKSLPGEPSYYLDYVTAIHAESGKPLKKTVYKSIYIQSPQDLARYVEMEFKYDSMNEQLFMNKIEVLDEKNKVVGGADISKFYIVDDSDAGYASYNKVLHAPVSGVAVGTTLNIVYTTQDRHPFDAMFEEFVFGSTVPVLREKIILTGDTHLVSHSISNGPVLSEKNGAKIWSMDNIPAYKNQASAPEYDTYLPILRLGKTGEDWLKEGNEYLDLIEGELKQDTRVDQLAARLVQGATTQEEKVERIFKYVQDEYSYNAIEFGLRAMVPHSAGKILDQKYGDCKDHAVILRQLLLSTGIPANLVLVKAEGNVEPSLVSLQQFDHMIVYCPLYMKNPFLDATYKTLPPKFLGFSLSGKKGLVLERNASKLVDMNMTPAMAGKIDSQRVFSFEGNDLKVEETFTLEGYSASLMREFLQGASANDQIQQFQDAFFKGRRATLKSFEAENVEDYSKPLIMKLQYGIDNVLFYIGDNLTGELPLFWEDIYFALKYEKKRQAPLEFPYSETITGRLTFKTPKGYSLEQKNLPGNLNFSTKHISLGGDLKMTRDGFSLNSEMTQPSGIFPAGEFDEAVESTKKALDILRLKIVLTPS